MPKTNGTKPFAICKRLPKHFIFPDLKNVKNRTFIIDVKIGALRPKNPYTRFKCTDFAILLTELIKLFFNRV